jgi:hypothetical protein
MLRGLGPLFIGRWWVPAALAEALAKSGRTVPPPVTGAILIDTGADGTCISTAVATTALGLNPLRMQLGYGAGGTHQSPVFFAQFEFSIVDPKGIRTSFAWEQEVLGIPDLEHRRVTYAGREFAVIGLLGRDILRHCRMEYDGPAGTVRMQVDTSALKVQPAR